MDTNYNFFAAKLKLVAAEPPLIMALLLAIYLKAWNGNSSAFAAQGGK